MTVIIERLEENRRLLSVVVDYLMYSNKNKVDYDPDIRVRRRTVRLRHIQATLLIEGIKAGELSPSVSVKDFNELFYSTVEAAVFRLAVARRASAGKLKDAMRQAIHCLLVK